MASATAFQATYLTPGSATSVPPPLRFVLASPVHKLVRLMSDGCSAAVAHQITDTPKVLAGVQAVAVAVNATQPNPLQSDYAGIDSI